MAAKRYRRIAFLGSVFVLAPAVLLIVVGILVLTFQRTAADITFGVLILCFCATLMAGTIILVAALKRQWDIARLQSDFVSKVSHDFRTPLTSIRMFVETLSEGRIADVAQRDRVLARLGEETERLSRHIDRLLEFARLEAGRMRFDVRAEPLEPIVRATVARFEPRILGQDAEIGVELPADLPLVRADTEGLADVIENLLDNAFKYTGPVKRIAIRARMARRRVELLVEDNGPGVQRRDQRRIFERFYRVDDRLSRATEGSGLGLAICKHIVANLGGNIRVESRSEGGARFIVSLRAA